MQNEEPCRLLRLPEVARLTGLQRSSLYEMARQGEFPKPRQLTARAVAWRADEVSQWINARPTARVGNT